MFGEDIPTNMEVIGAETLNFRPKFKFLQFNFIRGPRIRWGGALGSPGQSLARLKILSPIHTADADETKLFCRVASASAVCT